jgi:hypothetical protein
VNTNTDYAMKPEHAEALAGAALLPRDLRVLIARRLLAQKIDAAELVADIIGMANSVVANTAELLKTEAVIRGWIWPHQAEQLNFPSMNGALMGVSLAHGVDAARVCATCAFRLGSVANQCAPTQHDAKDAVRGEFAFMCHEGVDEKDVAAAKHGCRGFALARKCA